MGLIYGSDGFWQELQRWKGDRAEGFAGMLASVARMHHEFDALRTNLWRDAAVEFGVPAANLPRS